MRFRKQSLLAGLAVWVLWSSGCRDNQPVTTVAPARKPVIYTEFYPGKYFAERIGGDLIKVVCPVPEDADAIFWRPSTAEVQAYQNADLVVLNGAAYAKWVAWVSLPRSRVVEMARPLEDKFITIEKAMVHSHGAGGAHAHEGLDPNTWLDPVQAIIQAGEIKQALVKRYPQHAEAFEKGFNGLVADLGALDATLKAYQAGTNSAQPFFVSHPVFNYIARRYGWNMKTLTLDAEEMPDDKTFEMIGSMLKEFPAKYLLWESTPTPEVAARLEKEFGLKSVDFLPCESITDQERTNGADYLSVMRRNVANLALVFKGANN